MKRLAFLLVALLTACAHGGGFIPEPAQPGDANAKSVRDLVPYASDYHWQRSPYYRPLDLGWPWYVILANDGTACPLFKNIVFLPNRNDYFACPISWRQARP
jgi:hypothetical protein